MAQKNNGQPPMPKYLTEFSKAIANEVKILLADVGRLREERQKLTIEVAQLLDIKAKYSDGVPPEWLPKGPEPPAVEAPPAPPAIEEAPVQARPGWRVVHKREKRPKKITAPPASAPTPAPVPPPEPPRPEVPAWAQWRPNPLLAPPTPGIPPVAAPQSPPPRSGLFGPSTPPPK
ncbi:hypothetical protein BDQ17DRAFT_1371406 [Cyathus striatus]|nr:hypothetical protein BDQ17DRAFT_1371406 [Cyathus striatus]